MRAACCPGGRNRSPPPLLALHLLEVCRCLAIEGSIGWNFGVITAWNVSAAVLLERGFACLIQKPFDWEVLLTTIAACPTQPDRAESASQEQRRPGDVGGTARSSEFLLA